MWPLTETVQNELLISSQVSIASGSKIIDIRGPDVMAVTGDGVFSQSAKADIVRWSRGPAVIMNFSHPSNTLDALG